MLEPERRKLSRGRARAFPAIGGARPLVRRKRRLRAIVPAKSCWLLYIRHIERAGVEFLAQVCRAGLEGIVAKWKDGPYRTAPTSRIKIKNPNCSPAEGRHERFERMRAGG